jgi:hypothetical protein
MSPTCPRLSIYQLLVLSYQPPATAVNGHEYLSPPATCLRLLSPGYLLPMATSTCHSRLSVPGYLHLATCDQWLREPAIPDLLPMATYMQSMATSICHLWLLVTDLSISEVPVR